MKTITTAYCLREYIGRAQDRFAVRLPSAMDVLGLEEIQRAGVPVVLMLSDKGEANGYELLRMETCAAAMGIRLPWTNYSSTTWLWALEPRNIAFIILSPFRELPAAESNCIWTYHSLKLLLVGFVRDDPRVRFFGTASIACQSIHFTC